MGHTRASKGRRQNERISAPPTKGDWAVATEREPTGVEMRDPKRIQTVLKLLEKVWKKFPDYRLGQLLENVATAAGRPDHCVFHIGDDEWVKFLREYAPEVKK